MGGQGLTAGNVRRSSAPGLVAALLSRFTDPVMGRVTCWTCDRVVNAVTRICRRIRRGPSSAPSNAHGATIVRKGACADAVPIAAAPCPPARHARGRNGPGHRHPQCGCSNRRNAEPPSDDALPQAEFHGQHQLHLILFQVSGDWGQGLGTVQQFLGLPIQRLNPASLFQTA